MSKHKDKNDMKDNTIDNLPILVGKLNEYGINVCSITDHDVFDYNLYLEWLCHNKWLIFDEK